MCCLVVSAHDQVSGAGPGSHTSHSFTGAMSSTPNDNLAHSSRATRYIAEEAWGLTTPIAPMSANPVSLKSTVPMAMTKDQFRDVVLQTAQDVMTTHHGPAQFLMHRYPTTAAKAEYNQNLWKMFPPMDCVHYQSSLQGPVSDDPIFFHLACLSFDPACSPREPTRASTAMELIYHILTDGFMTKGDCIITNAGGPEQINSIGLPVSKDAIPWKSSDPLKPLGVAIQKGNARVSTLHMIVTLCLDDEVDLQRVVPELWRSICEIRAVNISFGTLREHTFHNFKLSSRECKRRPPNVVSWVVVLDKMQQAGDKDAGASIRQWNKGNPKTNHVVCAKAQSVKHIMELGGRRTIDLLVNHVSEFGWDQCAFSEDCLASRKVFLGNHFRTASSKQWTQRQRVTPEAIYHLFLSCVRRFQKAPGVARRKLTTLQMEARSEVAAIVLSLAEETCNVGVPMDIVQPHFVLKWTDGDSRIDMELSSVLLDKHDGFTIRAVPTLKELLDKLNTNPSGDIDISMEESAVCKQSTDLQESGFNLVMSRLRYDIKCWRVFEAKNKNYDKAVFAKQNKIMW